MPPADDTCFLSSLSASLCSAGVCTRLCSLCRAAIPYFQALLSASVTSREAAWFVSRGRIFTRFLNEKAISLSRRLAALPLFHPPAATLAPFVCFAWRSVQASQETGNAATSYNRTFPHQPRCYSRRGGSEAFFTLKPNLNKQTSVLA